LDKRTLYALLMIMVMFLIFNQFVWKPQSEQKQKQQQATPTRTTTLTDTTKAHTQTTPEAVVESIEAGIEVKDDIILKNSLVEVTLSNRGGIIRQVKLLSDQFKMPDGSPVLLIPGGGTIAGLTLKTQQGNIHLPDLILSYNQPSDTEVEFFLRQGEAQVYHSRFVLNEDYGISFSFKVENWHPVSGSVFDVGSGIADTEARLKTKAQDYRFILNANNQMSKHTMADLGTGKTEFINSFNWAALRSKYFVLAVKEGISESPVLTNQYTAKTINYLNPKQEQAESPAFALKSDRDFHNTWQQGFLIYAGPTDFDILKQYGNEMESIVERGAKWLLWLSNIFAAVLTFLHKIFHNYGIVIIVFSILLKIVLYPLTLKTTRSMIKMQQIQPQIQELQRKYKDDRKRQQQEIMQLYKETGTNPFGGCWPFLLQMPIFFSLFNVLRYSLEMRNAHFVGWITDLSEPDPYLVLPILMAVFMVVQQRMMRPPAQNPADMDDKQRAAYQSTKMMAWIMPVMMFFIFKGMPAGLVLYWTIFNILSVIHQYYIQKHFKMKEAQ